jgi:hypothetical protein
MISPELRAPIRRLFCRALEDRHHRRRAGDSPRHRRAGVRGRAFHQHRLSTGGRPAGSIHGLRPRDARAAPATSRDAPAADDTGPWLHGLGVAASPIRAPGTAPAAHTKPSSGSQCSPVSRVRSTGAASDRSPSATRVHGDGTRERRIWGPESAGGPPQDDDGPSTALPMPALWHLYAGGARRGSGAAALYRPGDRIGAGALGVAGADRSSSASPRQPAHGSWRSDGRPVDHVAPVGPRDNRWPAVSHLAFRSRNVHVAQTCRAGCRDAARPRAARPTRGGRRLRGRRGSPARAIPICEGGDSRQS